MPHKGKPFGLSIEEGSVTNLVGAPHGAAVTLPINRGNKSNYALTESQHSKLEMMIFLNGKL